MWAGPDAEIASQSRPAALCIERRNPFGVRHVVTEPLAKGDDRVIGEEFVQRSGKPGWQVVVQQELQAASFCSNASASRTAAGATS